MKRRTSILLTVMTLALTTTMCIGAGWAQTSVLRVGILHNSEQSVREWLSSMHFDEALSEQGWTEGKNVSFEFRDSGGDPKRLAEPAAALVRLKVDVLFAVGPDSVRAAVAATREIPIVAFDLESDPVAMGYVQSYGRPGGNLTGLFLDSPELAGKWVELLRTLRPGLSRAVVVWDPTSGSALLEALRSVAHRVGLKLRVLEIHAPADIDKAPSAFGGRPQVMIILPSPMMWVQSAHLAELARRHHLPATSMLVPFADAGGLVVYGPDMAVALKQCARVMAKVLAGTKPGDLPIERPTRFDLVLNLKTARDLGLTVPDSVLLSADRVINK